MRSHQDPVGDLATELVPVPDGGWVACDRSLRADDPRRVIAHLDYRGRDVSVTWVREQRRSCSYPTMGDALRAMSCSLHEADHDETPSSAARRAAS
jgi:hypothetical protein